MTEGERRLWTALRRKSFGVRVRPQFPIGPYVLDFYIPRLRLCIEVDGDFHTQDKERDDARDEFLLERGIETVRFTSWQVAKEFDSVIYSLDRTIRARMEHRSD